MRYFLCYIYNYSFSCDVFAYHNQPHLSRCVFLHTGRLYIQNHNVPRSLVLPPFTITHPAAGAPKPRNNDATTFLRLLISCKPVQFA